MNLAPSLLQSLVAQIALPPEKVSEVQQERMERVLIELLDHNLKAIELQDIIGVSRGTVAMDLTKLAQQGYIVAWMHARSKWISLTHKGIARARILREMQ